MSAPERSPTTGAVSPVSGGKSPRRQQAKTWLVIAALVAPCVLIGIFNGSDSTDVPAPAADERADTVPLLTAAADSQGVCYGWRLYDYSTQIDAGSNLGDRVPVGDDERCPRWLEVSAVVRYTSSSSESSDSATVSVSGSADIDPADLWTVVRGLDRFGLDSDAFVDDPGWAITRAATVLPLLAAEAGLAEPVDPPTAGPAAAPSPLPAAGNDLWRDRSGWLLATVGLFLFAALLITVGVVQRRRQLRVAAPAQRAGAGAAGRTRETA
ncbi:hypothetical protein ACFO0M_22930 [Micromonospora mangrovi]|uniref:Uncharacterized protein n=2 Tax=Micromonospora TaxID=1873 RepID=A0AAU8HB96_9ACTN